MSGIADLVLAAMLIWGWPSTATWALGLIAGLSLSLRAWQSSWWPLRRAT